MCHDPQTDMVIEAGKGELRYLSDLWHYRELFYFLSWRDVLVRYKQTVIGIAWSLIRPLLAMTVFTIIFGKFLRLPSEGAPYPILVFTAMLPWQLFAGALSDSSNSVVTNAGMVSKIYFPRVIIPASSVIVNLVDFAISFCILLAMMAYYHFMPGWRILALPGFLLLGISAAFGAGLWISALNVKYRDFRYVVPFLVQLGIYISPVGFSSSIVPEKWHPVYSINPMVGVIDGFRWAVLGGQARLYWPGFALSIGLTMLVLILGFRYFRKTERTFADVI